MCGQTSLQAYAMRKLVTSDYAYPSAPGICIRGASRHKTDPAARVNACL